MLFWEEMVSEGKGGERRGREGYQVVEGMLAILRLTACIEY